MFDVTEAQKHFSEIGLAGWLEDWDLKHIYEEVSKLEPGQVYVEIGVAYGKSFAVASLAAKEGVEIHGIDTLNWGNRETNVDKFLEFYGKKAVRHFHQGDSQNLAKFWSKPIDVLFIDGDHTSWGVIKDIVSWIPHVKHGGIIMFDDYNGKEGVQPVLDITLRDHNQFLDHQIDGQMYICRKK